MRTMRLLRSGLATVAAFALLAVPASAQTQEGLVNVNISDVEVGLPVAIAANVCDVNANVLARQLRNGGAECDATADSDATFGGGNGSGSPQQEGLVNVNVSDVEILVPIAIAANICDVNVNVLAEQLREGGASCDAAADSTTA